MVRNKFVKAKKRIKGHSGNAGGKLLQKCCCWLVRHVKHGKTESNMKSSPKDEGTNSSECSLRPSTACSPAPNTTSPDTLNSLSTGPWHLQLTSWMNSCQNSGRNLITSCKTRGGRGLNDWDYSEIKFGCCSDISGVRHTCFHRHLFTCLFSADTFVLWLTFRAQKQE